ncbi:amidohydrolase [bacterium]|nr:amidohydrolase [candidate division CSSED10-310 bacterium]
MNRFGIIFVWICIYLGGLMLTGCAGIGVFPRTSADPADLAICRAAIFTCNASQPEAEALAVKGNRIVYVGSNEGLTDYLGPSTRLINAKGRRITPGFIDNHCHVLWIGGLTYLMPADLYACADHAELAAVLKRRAAVDPELIFIGGIGWKMENIPGNIPRKELLDAIIPDRPVILMSYSGQCGWLNSMAIHQMESRNPAAFDELVPVRDGQGHCTGELRHFHAVNFLDFYPFEEMGEKTREGIMRSMTRALDDALALGVTCMNDVQIYRQFIPFILEFKDKGGLDKARVRCSYYIGHSRLVDEEQLRADLTEWKLLGSLYSDSHLIFGDSVKLYIDGTPDNRTAFLFEPYITDPETVGEPVWTEEEFRHVIQMVDAMGLQAVTHSIGDAGIHRVINAYEAVIVADPAKDLRHRVDHCEIPAVDDIGRMGRLGIPAAMQPTHFYGDAMIEEGFGVDRMQRFMPWRSLEKAGVPVSFGSDWCAGPINPIYGLLISAKRMNYKGKTDWNKAERIPLANGVRHWTIDSAHALHLEKDLGSIEVGKRADLVMFNEDPLVIDSIWFLLTHDIELGKLDDFVDLTIVDGKEVYRNPQTSDFLDE